MIGRGQWEFTSRDASASLLRPRFPHDPRRAKAARMTNDDPRQRLLVTWKLIAAIREEIPPGAKTDFLGSHPTGYINYAPDGRMMVLNVGNGRSKPAGGDAEPAGGGTLVRRADTPGRTTP